MKRRFINVALTREALDAMAASEILATGHRMQDNSRVVDGQLLVSIDAEAILVLVQRMRQDETLSDCIIRLTEG